MPTKAKTHPNQALTTEGVHAADNDGTGSDRIVTDRFVSCKVGGMLLLKIAGFIQDERAELINITEHDVTLRLGQPWYRRWWSGTERRRPIEVHLRFSAPGDDLATWQTASARRSVVEARIRPLSSTHRTEDFLRRADAIRNMLRLHFVAD